MLLHKILEIFSSRPIISHFAILETKTISVNPYVSTSLRSTSGICILGSKIKGSENEARWSSRRWYSLVLNPGWNYFVEYLQAFHAMAQTYTPLNVLKKLKTCYTCALHAYLNLPLKITGYALIRQVPYVSSRSCRTTFHRLPHPHTPSILLGSSVWINLQCDCHARKSKSIWMVKKSTVVIHKGFIREICNELKSICHDHWKLAC